MEDRPKGFIWKRHLLMRILYMYSTFKDVISLILMQFCNVL